MLKLTKLEKTAISIAGFVIVVLGMFVYTGSNTYGELFEFIIQDNNQVNDENVSAFRINSDCELITLFTEGEYPDGEKITSLKIDDLIFKYPEIFGKWIILVSDQEKLQSLVDNGFPEDFKEKLVSALIIEHGIDPILEPTLKKLATPESDLSSVLESYHC